MTSEIAERDIQQCEKLAKAADSAGRDGWISLVVKGELCEKQLNYTDNWRVVLRVLSELETCRAKSAQ